VACDALQAQGFVVTAAARLYRAAGAAFKRARTAQSSATAIDIL